VCVLCLAAFFRVKVPNIVFLFTAPPWLYIECYLQKVEEMQISDMLKNEDILENVKAFQVFSGYDNNRHIQSILLIVVSWLTCMISCSCLSCSFLFHLFQTSVLTLLVGSQEEHPTCKKIV